MEIEVRTYQRYVSGERMPNDDILRGLERLFDKPVYYYSTAAKDTEEKKAYIKAQAQALMAGGELSLEDQEAFMQELLEISEDSKRRKQKEQELQV